MFICPTLLKLPSNMQWKAYAAFDITGTGKHLRTLALLAIIRALGGC